MKLFSIFNKIKVICWWSGGVTSAIACRLAIKLFGIKNCRIIFIDTKNEHEDTYRFLKDCEKWYGKKIEKISNPKYKSIEEVWFKFLGMNFAHGAICSTELKRVIREKFEKENKIKYQVFGFDIKENKRALALKINYPKSKPIFPLLFHALTKNDCINILIENNIEIPIPYKWGFHNNNCMGHTGCVQGGIGYWQKIKKEHHDKFEFMASMEHKLTNKKGSPVTICRDQSKKAKNEKNTLIFLKPHPKYPNIKDISMFKGREPETLIECNGWCGSNDLNNI